MGSELGYRSPNSTMPMTRQALPVMSLSSLDLDAVEALRAENNDTVGFLPKPVMEDYLQQGGGLGIRDGNHLIAYALYAPQQYHLRLIHLCITSNHRRSGHARRLVEAVVGKARQRRVGEIRLNCRRDYAAHSVWPRLDFVAVAERTAKTKGALLTTWCRGIPGAAQPSIFSTLASDEVVHAVIDAQLVFRLRNGDQDVVGALRADFLDDLLLLHITNETLNEIARASSRERRAESRSHALSFPRVEHDSERMEAVAHALKGILPSSTPREESDIRQIAMTAASEVGIFLTLDERLLKEGSNIRRLAGVEVLEPNKLIVRLHKFANEDSYGPRPVSGTNLSWRKVDDAYASVHLASGLLGPHERKTSLKDRLNRVLSRPQTWRTEGLWAEETLVAIRSVRPDDQHRRLVVGVCRALQGADQPLFTDYAVASVLSDAVGQGYDSVLIERDSTAPEATSRLPQLGFTETDEGFIGDCPATVMPSSRLRTNVHPRHGDATLQELERACSPVALEDSVLAVFMVPIKPGYARSLFDTELAASDMFGADSRVLLRLENVYFRKKSHHRMIQAPARVLWYESDGAGVVATSHLDGVRIGSPKAMFREHRRLGTLSWPDIWAMCRGDQLKEIMVLKFSRSYMFRSPVDLRSLREIYRNRSKSLVLQSPSRVPREIFLDIYHLGFHAGCRR